MRVSSVWIRSGSKRNSAAVTAPRVASANQRLLPGGRQAEVELIERQEHRVAHHEIAPGQVESPHPHDGVGAQLGHQLHIAQLQVLDRNPPPCLVVSAELLRAEARSQVFPSRWATARAPFTVELPQPGHRAAQLSQVVAQLSRSSRGQLAALPDQPHVLERETMEPVAAHPADLRADSRG